MLYKNETEFQFLISIKECLVTVKEGGKKRKEKKKKSKRRRRTPLVYYVEILYE